MCVVQESLRINFIGDKGSILKEAYGLVYVLVLEDKRINLKCFELFYFQILNKKPTRGIFINEYL